MTSKLRKLLEEAPYGYEEPLRLSGIGEVVHIRSGIQLLGLSYPVPAEGDPPHPHAIAFGSLIVAALNELPVLLDIADAALTTRTIQKAYYENPEFLDELDAAEGVLDGHLERLGNAT